MLDILEVFLTEEVVTDSDGVIANTMETWRRTPEEIVHFTRHEAEQMGYYFAKIVACPSITPKQKAENIARAIDYKMHYEIQEAWERRNVWIATPQEIMVRIKKLDISEHGKIVGIHFGKSDYVVIVINQFHRGLNDVPEPELITVQREIATIENTIIDQGISNVLAIEGSDTKEIALELVEPHHIGPMVEYSDFLECSCITDNPSINDIIAGNYGASLWQEGHLRSALHTFGVETPIVHDKAAAFNLLAKELIGVFQDLSYFGEEKNCFFGEEDNDRPEKTFPKTGLMARLETTLKASGIGHGSVQQALQVLDQVWQKANIAAEDIILAAREVHTLMWEFSIDTRNMFFPINIKQIRQNTLTNAIILLVGVYHNQKEPGQAIMTLTDALLDYDISYIVIQPHSVQAILDKQG